MKKFGLALALGLAFAVLGGSASAHAAETIIDISGMTNTSTIKSSVEAALQENYVVTVVNNANTAYDTNGADLKITIPKTKKILWQADYSGEVAVDEALLFLAGGGTLEISNCTLSNTGEGSVVYQGNGNIVISNNAKITGNNIAIAGNGDINIQSGEIVSKKGVGAVLCYGKLSMSGGVIFAYEGYAVSASGINSSVDISGGFVFAHFANTDTAESAHGVSSNKLESAFVMFSGEPTIGENAAIAVWDTLSGVTEYVSGTADDMTVYPEKSVVWWMENGQSGLRYNSSVFYPYDKVTVIDPLEVPAVSDGPTTDSGTNLALTAGIIGTIVVVLAALLALMQIMHKRRAAAAGADETTGKAADATMHPSD